MFGIVLIFSFILGALVIVNAATTRITDSSGGDSS
jgi:uncharacterized integral membrane protein